MFLQTKASYDFLLANSGTQILGIAICSLKFLLLRNSAEDSRATYVNVQKSPHLTT